MAAVRIVMGCYGGGGRRLVERGYKREGVIGVAGDRRLYPHAAGE